MRILLETPEDKLQCLAYLVSAAVRDDAEPNVVLDFRGEIDRHRAAWRAHRRLERIHGDWK